MILAVALLFSVVFQFVAAVIAVSLIRQTRFNFSWVLISVAFILMAVRRLSELIEVWQSGFMKVGSPFASWTAVAISVFILVGVIYIQQIFRIQRRIDDMQRENEAKVLSAIIKTEETERQKFAKELHDGLGPLLSSVKMALSALKPGERKSENQKILDNTSRLIDESLSTIKEISNKLSPHVLNNFGLHKAVKSFIERMGPSGKPRVKVNSNIENVRFDYNIEVVLYRVIGELISNTINHADAGEVNIDLNYDRNHLTLDYFDNGKGFDPEEVLNAHTGMGLSNIRSRIKSIDGTLNVMSNPDEGVFISIAVKTGKHA
ncbi:MAG: sensor histidine kinase [Bacteroidales bacterium]|nr:sensor histidine kinase [Bacteroidales bacterium]